jgi:hypothetical protein
MKRIFRTRAFSRWMRKSKVIDATLIKAIDEMSESLIDADLGQHVFKKRIAIAGRGKRGGARTIVATNLGSRWYFVFGFSKNERANIESYELRALQELASSLLSMSETQIAAAISVGEIVEVLYGE